MKSVLITDERGLVRLELKRNQPALLKLPQDLQNTCLFYTCVKTSEFNKHVSVVFFSMKRYHRRAICTPPRRPVDDLASNQ